MFNQEIEKLIENQPKQKNVIDFLFNSPYFVRSTEYVSTIEEYSEVIVFNNKESNKFIYVIIGFITFIFGFCSIEDASSRYVFFGLLLFLLLFTWYNKTRKKEEIKISEEGIEINTTKYFWNQIYDYGLTIVPRNKTSDCFLEIFTISGAKLSFGLYNYLSPDSIIETMNFFRNRFHANKN